MTSDAEAHFQEHLLEVFGPRCEDFSEDLRAKLRSLWVHGATSGLSAEQLGHRRPMSREEQAMHEFQPRHDPAPATMARVDPSPLLDPTDCPDCDGVGWKAGGVMCTSCAGMGRVG